MTTTIEDRMILLLNEQARLAPSEDERPKGALRRAFDTLLPRPESGRGYLERLTEYTVFPFSAGVRCFIVDNDPRQT